MLDLPPSLVTQILLTNSKISHYLAYFQPFAHITAPRHPLHAIQLNHGATSLISVTFFVFTKNCRDGTGVQMWTLASLVRGKSHFMPVQAQVLCVHVCVDGDVLGWWLPRSACTAAASFQRFATLTYLFCYNPPPNPQPPKSWDVV